MKKRLYIYLGVVALMLAAVIVSAIYENAYRVYLLPEVSQVFKEKTATSADFGSAESKISAKATRELNFRDNTVTVNYNEALSNEMHAYSTEDNRINCWYDTHTDALRLISAEDWFPVALRSGVTEEECLNWVYEQVAPYYTENWDTYRLSCTTVLLSTQSGAPVQMEKSGFSVAGENETVMSYVFSFTRMIGEFETADTIQAYIHPENGFAAVEFSAHRFDETTLPDVDMARLRSEIKHFIRTSLNTKKYEYVRHELQQPKFAYINSTLCIVCSVSVEVTSKDGAQVIGQQLAVVIR